MKVCALLCVVTALSSAGAELIVHLMDWRFDDIARECEIFLSKAGYDAVLVSPVHEPPALAGMPWWERYQVFSYNVSSISGNATDFKNMTQRCGKAGIKVYVEVVLNHMSTNLPIGMIGVGGSSAVPYNKEYPAIPFAEEHFHPTCAVFDYFNASNVRKCELDHQHDLFQKHEHVRSKQTEFLNALVDLGARGFKICNAKHMFVDDLEIIISRVKNLPTGGRPFVVLEVELANDNGFRGKEAIQPKEYLTIGPVTEFKFQSFMTSVTLMERDSNISALATNFSQNMIESSKAVVFVDLMDPKKVWDIGLRKFRVFNTFMLAQPYGAYKKILSSYWMNLKDMSPPHYDNMTVKHVEFKDGDWCKESWNCEHRDPVIRRMIQFSKIVNGTTMTNVTVHKTGNFTQISFCRPGKGFVAISDIGYSTATITAQTCLPPGRYCNVVSGSYLNKKGKRACTYTEVVVGKNGSAAVTFTPQEDGIVALHIREMATNGAASFVAVLSILTVTLTLAITR